IDTSARVWLYSPAKHKNVHRGKPRVIVIGPRAQAILRPYLKRDLAAPLFSPAESEARRGREYQCGTSYRPETYRQAVHNACIRGGLELWNVGQLRHTAGTEIRKRYGLDGAGAVLGHARLETTAAHYAERSLELAVRVAAETG